MCLVLSFDPLILPHLLCFTSPVQTRTLGDAFVLKMSCKIFWKEFPPSYNTESLLVS